MKELLKFEDINISYDKKQVLYDLSFSKNFFISINFEIYILTNPFLLYSIIIYMQ